MAIYRHALLALVLSLSVLPDDRADLPQNHGFAPVDGRIRRIFGHQPDLAVFAAQALDGRLVADERDDDVAVVGGLLLSAALTSMLTGITEPLEFTFLFVAPVMYAVHCVLAGLSYMLMHIFNVGVGMTFSGGAIDLTLFGSALVQGKGKPVTVPLTIAHDSSGRKTIDPVFYT